MLRWIFFLRYPDGVAEQEGERWYLETHTQEAKHLSGLRRYLSWRTERAYAAPLWTTLDRLNYWHRVTELAFDDWDAWHEAAVLHPPEYTRAPYGPRGFDSQTIFIDDAPDDDFLGVLGLAAPAAASTQFIRWLFLLRYGDNTTFEGGESWYLGTHTEEAREMAGLRRYRSWKALMRPGYERSASAWDRLTELGFASWQAWEDGAVTNMPAWTPPPYAQPGFISQTAFIGEQPEYDFLKDSPTVGRAAVRDRQKYRSP